MFRFKLGGDIWLYPGNGAWHFVNIEPKVSAQIKDITEGNRRGWGSVRVAVESGGVRWSTSIFPDKSGVYLLPVKKAVLKTLGISVGDRLEFDLSLLDY